jgi:hypothetical protein
MERAYRLAFDTGGGFSVIGRGVVGTMSIWHTIDGSEWTGTDLDVCEDVADCDVEAMATIGDRLVAIHSHAGQGTIWLSTDGMNWLQQATPEVRPPGVSLADELSVAGLEGQLFVFVNSPPDELEAMLLRGDESTP